MATTTIPWNDGSGDNIYLTYPSASGNQTVAVSSDANTGSVERTQTVTFSASANGQTVTKTLTLVQAKVAEQYIVFADPLVEQICATNWGDGTGITPTQAAAVSNSQFETTFRGTAIVSFNEFAEYFTGITSLSSNAFRDCTSLQSIKIGANVTAIGGSIFRGCSSLKNVDILSTSSFPVSAFVQSNGSFGDGTGTFHLAGGITTTGNYTLTFNFKTIRIDGNINPNVSNRYIFAGNAIEKFIVGGNLTILYPLVNSTSFGFLELGGTYNYNVVGTSIPTTTIAHLKYNGIAGTPAQLRIARIAKVYVDSQAVLNQYLADSAWSQYSSQLDLWENYNGDYK